jgi:glycerol-1-phosphate dehydrogenase [NAD(P)+]
MTPLAFDPSQGERFWAALREIPGYPAGEPQPIKAMVFESNALARLPELLRLAGAQPGQPLLVVMDRTPMRRNGADLKAQVLAGLRETGWLPEPIWLSPDDTGQVHTDFAQIERVQAQLRAGAGVLSVGSGTVTDVAKHACYLWAEAKQGGPLPFVVYQTANSVSAYTSNMAPVFMEGVKRTLPSRYPDVLVCDLETVRDAPASMTAAGVGDLVAALGSYADWYLAYQLGLDGTHTEFARTLMGPLDDILWAQAPAIRAGDLEATAVLAKLITLAGLAMSLSHATAPLSGFEHVISHVLDLMAEKAGRPLAQHGTQVALATLLTTRAWALFLEEFDPGEMNLEACYPSAATMEARIRETFAGLDPSGRAAEECWADYRLKLEAWHQQRARTQAAFEHWPSVRVRLQERLGTWQRAAEILERAGATLRFEALDPPATEADARFAFFAAPLIRRRLTLGDLLILMQWEAGELWRRVWTPDAPPAPLAA